MKAFLKKMVRGGGVLMAVLALAACTVGPDYIKPEVETPEQFRYAPEKPGPSESIGKEWWPLFQDVLLIQLIEQAEQGSFSLMAAATRVEQARATARISQSGLFPNLTAEPSIQKGEISKTMDSTPGASYTTYGFPFNIAYELDLFGKLRRNYEASLAEAEAVQEDLNAARLMLQTDIAIHYFAMRSYDEEIRIVQRTIEIRREQLKILNSRLQYGAISQLPVAQAEAELNATEALLYDLQQKRGRLENAIAVLLGKTPSEISFRSDPLQEPPPEAPAVLPSGLLTGRPDIRRAERIMAAENARIGAAEASFYPEITLSANAGLASSHSGDIFDSDSFAWGLMPKIRIPLFEGGRNIAGLDRAKARYAEAYANYRQTIVQAFGEVEDALMSTDLLKKQTAANQLAIESAKKAYGLSKKQYEGGLVNYMSLLDTERTLLDNIRLNSQLRGRQYMNLVNLIKAVGGGW
jgi:multidrug efflux system outer membrane protein